MRNWISNPCNSLILLNKISLPLLIHKGRFYCKKMYNFNPIKELISNYLLTKRTHRISLIKMRSKCRTLMKISNQIFNKKRSISMRFRNNIKNFNKDLLITKDLHMMCKYNNPRVLGRLTSFLPIYWKRKLRKNPCKNLIKDLTLRIMLRQSGTMKLR